MTGKRGLVVLLGTLAAGYLAILVWFRVNESHLLYFPERGPTPLPAGLRALGAEARALPSADSGQVAAWVIPPADSSARWVLVLHGNAGNLATPGRPEHDRQLHDLGLGVLALDYRGYGESDGVPTEAGLTRDALTGYHFLRDSLQLPPSRILIYGHSLGSGVATALATQVEAAGLILEGAFTSVPDRGAELYPWVPVHLLAQSRFDSRARIGRLRMPLLILHGRDDQTIPIGHGRRLFDAAPEPKLLVEVPGGHDDAFETGRVEYQRGVRQFLQSLP